MSKQEEEFHNKLLATFRIEADEYIKLISSGLVALENIADENERNSIVENIYRAVHSLKGSSRAVNVTDVEIICQSIETVFSDIKKGAIVISPELLDSILRAMDLIGQIIFSPLKVPPSEISNIIRQVSKIDTENENIEISSDIRTNKSVSETRQVSDREEINEKDEGNASSAEEQNIISSEKEKMKSAPSSVLIKDKKAYLETIRIPIERLEMILLQIEELLPVKQTAKKHSDDIENIVLQLIQWIKKFYNFFPDLNNVLNLYSENAMEIPDGNVSISDVDKLKDFINQTFDQMKLLEQKSIKHADSISNNYEVIMRKVDSLLEDMKSLLMLPIATILEVFPKHVRDLSRENGKEVNLVIKGSEVEIDKRILEAIKDPLLHIIRNCIDHGIESQEERLRKGKAKQGIVTIEVSQKDNSKVEIIISDDGGGIDCEKIKNEAVKRGLIPEEESEKLNNDDAVDYLFLSEFSTSPIVTDLSGRGLGLSIVKEKIEQLGGVVFVKSEIHTGTILRIHLPLSIATFRGVLVEVSGELFIIPDMSIERVARINVKDVITVENRETILIDDEPISLFLLSDVLQLPQNKNKNDENDCIYVVLLRIGNNRIAFMVDKVINEQEILVKKLGMQLSRVKNISGATILGTGEIIPIINVSDSYNTAVKLASGSMESFIKAKDGISIRKSILVAEDSITSRMLMKNILESAGYEVAVAVDGAEAFSVLKTKKFDLLVSDVDMPRMNGFELTDKIRNYDEIAHLPVVLVTALESREDRERGIDVGASAYIAKSSFDQSNLVEVIRKLI